jgi:N-acetylglutamate synthase-like GNAT family acetyltransferase
MGVPADRGSLAARVRTAHGDAWQVEGRARRAHGGGTYRVRGARLMASGLPTPKWNNADITAADVDLEAVAAWYATRALPWGIRLPVELDRAVGERLFTKRAFGLERPDALRVAAAGSMRVRRAGPADLDAYVATDAAAFGEDVALTRDWNAPVVGLPAFAHWLALEGETPVGVVCTVRSDEWAGPAAMVTGLGVRAPWRDRGVEEDLLREAVQSAFDAGVRLVHAYATGDVGAAWLQARGFREVPGFAVRVVRPP